MISKDLKKSKTKEKERFLFNPFEMAFCGYSNSGKTTLINRLIKKLSEHCTVGYLKHDVHHFDMDREGKDTWLAWQSGASQVLISDSLSGAKLQRGSPNRFEQKSALINTDVVLIEGYKNEDLTKVVMIDQERRILEKVESGEMSSIIAFVGQEECIDGLPVNIPYFQRDKIDDIYKFVVGYWQSRVPPLYGLVLTGGKSTRMKRDKALLTYSDSPEKLTQAESLYELLRPLTKKTFLSSRQGQWPEVFDHLPQIHDQFLEMGPLSGILSAQRAYPEAAWLVVACDLPFLTEDTLKRLLAHRDSRKFATCFNSAINGLPEPLCAIYEPKSYQKSIEFLAQGVECPRKILLNTSVYRVELDNSVALENINYAEEFEQAKIILQKNMGKNHVVQRN